MDSYALLVAIIVGVLIVGAFAYLLGKIKALKSEVEESAQKRPYPNLSPDVQVMSIPMGHEKPVSPRVIEIERELDTITQKLEWHDGGQRPKTDERMALEDRYNNLISEMVSHFVKEADHIILSTSLTGDNNVREERERVQGSQEVKTDVRKTA